MKFYKVIYLIFFYSNLVTIANVQVNYKAMTIY